MSVGSKEIAKIVCSMHFCVGLGVLIWSWFRERAWGTAPGPRGGVAPQTPSRCGYQSWKSDQLRRLGAAASMECLCASGRENNRASLSRGVIRFEALGVGVGREAVLMDA